MDQQGIPSGAAAPARSWQPYVGGLVGVVIAVLLWVALVAREKAQLREQVDVALSAAGKQLNSQVATIDRALHRVAAFAARDPAAPAWQQGIPVFERDAEWPRRMMVVDTNERITGAIPEPASGSAALDTLRMRGALTPPVRQVRYIADSSSAPILATVGVCDSVACRATLITEIELRAPILAAVGDTAAGFHFAVRVGRHDVMRTAPLNAADSTLLATDSIALGNVGLLLTAWPTRATIGRVRSNLPVLVLILGLAVSTLAVVTVLMSREARAAAESAAQMRLAEVAERRRVERVLHEMEALSMMGRLAARVAHEINNPLGGIQNAFLLIKDAIPLTHPHYKYVGAIDREIQRIALITRQLYETYRPENESSGSAAVRTVIGDAVSFLEQVNRPRGVRIVVDLSRAPSVAPVSAGLLRQCVYTLLQNAIDESQDRGEVEVTGAIEEDTLMLRVRDHGPGVPAGAFEPFSTSGAFNGGADGPALGLSLVRRSVVAIGGQVSVSEPPDGGAAFVVRFPLHPQAGVTQT